MRIRAPAVCLNRRILYVFAACILPNELSPQKRVFMVRAREIFVSILRNFYPSKWTIHAEHGITSEAMAWHGMATALRRKILIHLNGIVSCVISKISHSEITTLSICYMKTELLWISVYCFFFFVRLVFVDRFLHRMSSHMHRTFVPHHLFHVYLLTSTKCICVLTFICIVFVVGGDDAAVVIVAVSDATHRHSWAYVFLLSVWLVWLLHISISL